MKKNNNSNRIWLVMIFTIVISYIFFIYAVKNGIIIGNGNGNNNTKEYNSIDELKKSTSLSLDIPSYVSTFENIKIQKVYNRIYVIYCDKFAFKASAFVNIKADVLGLYESSEITEEYKVSNSNITYLKFRKKYKDYPNCTIINWCTDKVSYGLLVEDDLTLDNALEIVGISKNSIELYTDNNETDSEYIDINTELVNNIENATKYNINDKIELYLPEFKGDIKYVYSDTETLFFINDKLLIIIAYGDESKQDDEYNWLEKIKLDSTNRLYYNSSEPENKDSIDYENHQLLISTIDNICNTVVMK